MSDTSSKADSEKEYYLSASSSGSGMDPVTYSGHGKNESPTSRRGSLGDVSIYTREQVFGDMDSAEITKQREESRKFIINEVTQRMFQQGSRNDDLEKCPTAETGGADGALSVYKDGQEFEDVDPELITWDSDDDKNPRNWSFGLKLSHLALVSLYALVAPMSSSMLSPAMPEICAQFGVTSVVISAMVVSIQVLAWAFGPLIIAPFSEDDRFGRKIVLDVCVWISLFFNLGCAFSQTLAQLMLCRFFGGLFGCVPMNVCAGVIVDLFDAESRNFALLGYSLAPVMGPVIAPLISGFIIEHEDWRWVFYVLCMFNGGVAFLALIFFKETYAPRILKKKAQKLRKETGNESLHTVYELTNVETTFERMCTTVSRPVELLFMHPMVVGLGSFMAFTYGFMYLMIVTFPNIFKEKYHFKTGIVGLMYIPMGVGFVLGLIISTFAIDKTYKNLTKKNGGVAKPEYRLPCLFFSSFCIPVGLLWFGWSAQENTPWIMPGLGSAIFAMGLVCVFQTIQNYLIDMNHRFAASSVAAAALFRSLFGFTFPLFAGKMYEKLGYGWGNTMCAIISILLGVPFPILCILYGEKIRNWANKRMEVRQAKRDQKRSEKLQRKIIA